LPRERRSLFDDDVADPEVAACTRPMGTDEEAFESPCG
jgi:hypothetical protein